MSALDVVILVGVVAAAIVVGIFALSLLVWGLTWLSVLWMKRFNPAAYERYRIIRNLRKGAWKR